MCKNNKIQNMTNFILAKQQMLMKGFYGILKKINKVFTILVIFTGTSLIFIFN